MIDFDYSETAGWFGVYFVLIATILSIVFFFLGGLVGLRIGFRRLQPGWYPWIFLLIPISMIVGALQAAPAFWTVHEFRSLNPEQVSGLQVWETNETDGKVLQYSDKAETKKLLYLIQSCRHVEHQHDDLYDGYVLEILVDNGSSTNLALEVFRKSSMKGSRKAVIAKYSNWEAGEYNCPQIQDWVARNIDPLFGRSSTP